MNWRALTMAAVVGVAGATSVALAQNQEQPRERDGQNQADGERRRGDRGNFDPAEFQRRAMERIKEQLNAPDDEWTVIEPKLSKVLEAQRDARFGGGFGGRGPGGGGGFGGGRDGQEPTSEVAKAARELRTTLENENAAAGDIETKLAAYRAAREKANETLKTAREDLKSVLTQRQEAVLVIATILE